MDSLNQPQSSPTPGGSRNTIRISFIYFGVILLVSLLGFGVYAMFFSPTSEQDVVQQSPRGVTSISLPSGPSEDAVIAEQTAQADAAIVEINESWKEKGDADVDGLSDDREIELGTDVNNFDSDGDGVSDYTEVEIKGTDPLLADTDGDGVSDWNDEVNDLVSQ